MVAIYDHYFVLWVYHLHTLILEASVRVKKKKPKSITDGINPQWDKPTDGINPEHVNAYMFFNSGDHPQMSYIVPTNLKGRVSVAVRRHLGTKLVPEESMDN